MAGDLSRSDIEKAEFAFSIYDNDGSGKIDAADIGDVLRALNCNPTLALIEKMGGKKKRGEQKLTLEEFLPIYGQVKKEKEQGSYEDFLECLKLYDKNEDGTMLLAELNHTLLALGEALADEQVNEVFKDCMGEEDEEGNIKYAPNVTCFTLFSYEFPICVCPTLVVLHKCIYPTSNNTNSIPSKNDDNGTFVTSINIFIYHNFTVIANYLISQKCVEWNQ
ncbi:Myosin light chain alkali [Pseudolycoriella hygida]|uniref:Myosin light chain alkali n=1 Tax=Pseudolycoriella hygida TaxID=35572 RepID=A0A9Q0RYW5_9DIPT|nr:Myosin light chain alkali [Pseudolycoriella hygida]